MAPLYEFNDLEGIFTALVKKMFALGEAFRIAWRSGYGFAVFVVFRLA